MPSEKRYPWGDFKGCSDCGTSLVGGNIISMGPAGHQVECPGCGARYWCNEEEEYYDKEERYEEEY